MDVAKSLGAGVAIAEASRDKEKLASLMPDIFRGKLDVSYFEDLPKDTLCDLKFQANYRKLEEFLKTEVDPNEIEKTNEVPKGVLDWLCENGYFALKLPEKYGGMNLLQSQYMALLQLTATRCGALVALLSASNTIGVGWPIMAFGSPEQQDTWLPLVAKSPSGFAFTEEKAGSDPSSMETHAVRVRENGKVAGYQISGRKWWTTNGPASDNSYLSKVIIVIAKIVDYPDQLSDLEYKKNPVFGAFIVPTGSPGVKVVQRCEFLGLRGIYNGITDFEKVYIPLEQLIGKKTDSSGKTEYYQEGSGFRIALQALNSGRITVSGCCSATAKIALQVERWWGLTRHQWGKQIGQHELVGTGKLAEGVAKAFTMEAMTWFAAGRADKHLDCRMEAATAKVFNSEQLWQIVDDLAQIRGGRAYETPESLKKRGEAPIPVERMIRDARPNRIFEGESSILGLFVVREGVEEYKAQGEIFFEKGRYGKKMKAAVGFAKELAKLSIPNFKMRSQIKKFSKDWPQLAKHLLHADKCARKLAKAIIIISGKYQAKLMHKQLTLTRFFNIATEIYAMAAVCGYVIKEWPVHAKADLADFYCQGARRRIEKEFAALSDNSDALGRKIANLTLMNGYEDFLTDGTIPMVEMLDLKDPQPPNLMPLPHSRRVDRKA
ncbi:MAG: acyl-CoA dehydrogenase family protein [bacterium]|nr:acyl-CoA dehydrogenase family protein [bacterium]